MSNDQENKKIYIIKLIGNEKKLKYFRHFLNSSVSLRDITEESAKYYMNRKDFSKEDNDKFEEMKEDREYRCAFLDYYESKIECLYWTKCKKIDNGTDKEIRCNLIYKSEDESIIDNFTYSLQLDLNKDFAKDSNGKCSYINYEISASLLEQMSKFEKPYKSDTKSKIYLENENEKSLDDLAQKNEYCRRKYNFKESNDRGEYQRDYDRIIYSKAYRRMVDKAQIFSSIKGDHYRTRMTHTLIVCQIARSICDRLKLNSSLAEAIAAGHDLGHTPFGHQGERTLNNILAGEDGFEVEDLAMKIEGEDTQILYGGFKHNYQSVRVATSLESQYLEIDGLDLSEQTLDGMWKHTKKKEDMDIKDFSDGYLSDTSDFAFTMEGQVVAIADEIAQRSHDIDDAFASHLITISDFKDYLELRKHGKLKEEIDAVSKKLDDLKKENRLFVDENEVICAQISSTITKHFIDDACKATEKNMESYSLAKFNDDDHRLKEKLVCFSDEGDSLCKYLDNIITKKVISSHEVKLFDQNGSNIVLALFKAYYKNPMLLHDGTLKRIWNEYRYREYNVVDFKEGNPQLVKNEWKKITHDSNRLKWLFPIKENEKQNQKAEFTDDEKIEKQKAELTDDEKIEKQKEYFEKRKILVRNICDFISGMTDSYALNEYNKIIY